MVKGVQQKPAARSMKKPAGAGAMKKPAVIVFPITPKRGKGLRAMRRPERRDVAYTSKDKERIRRDRQVTFGTSVGIRLKSDREVARELTTLKLLPAVTSCSSCGGPCYRTDEYDKYHLHIQRCHRQVCRKRLFRVREHAFFECGTSRTIPLARQYQVLQMFLHGNSLVSIRMNLGLAHASIERFIKRVRTHIQDYIFARQDTFVYGSANELVQ
eukprot:3681339-Amphidinium_carterae.1